MSLQFIYDSIGKTMGVYIPIKEWNELKSRDRDIEQEQTYIPVWHKDIVRRCLNDFKKSHGQS